MQTFKENGFRIQDDIAFVGFTESQVATIIEPPLTSFAQPANEIEKAADQILLEQIESKTSFKPRTISLNGGLNIRASSLNNKK